MEAENVRGRGQLAKLFQVSTNSVVQMEQRGLPVLRKGRGALDPNIYHLPTVLAWRLDDNQRSALSSGDREALALRRANADTRKAEIEVAKLEGSLVDVEMIRQGLENVAVNFRVMALSVPAQIGRDIDEPEIRVRVVAIVERRIREMLELLSNYDPVIEPRDDDEGDSDHVAIAPPAQKPVKPRRATKRKQKQEAPCSQA